MADFVGMQITKLGRELMAKLLVSSLPTTITRIALGSGILPAGSQLEDMTALINQHTVTTVTSKQIIGNEVVEIEARFTSTDFPVAVMLHEIGVFAKDPESGVEILYAIDNAQNGDLIPALGGGTAIIRTFKILLTVANATNVTFVVDPSTKSYSVKYVKEITPTLTANQTEFNVGSGIDVGGALMAYVNGLARFDWTVNNSGNNNKVIFGTSNSPKTGDVVVFVEAVITS